MPDVYICTYVVRGIFVCVYDVLHTYFADRAATTLRYAMLLS